MGCSGVYWANLLISSITQTAGLSSGHLIDTKDFNFLTTDAVIQQVLQWMEKQIEFGDARGMYMNYVFFPNRECIVVEE